jgi:hypothetical protein
VIVDNFHIVSVAIGPGEADPPLVIDADAVLTLAIAAKLLKPITRRRAQILERLGGVKDDEFAQHDAAKVSRKPPNRLPLEQALGVTIGEAPDHTEA